MPKTPKSEASATPTKRKDPRTPTGRPRGRPPFVPTREMRNDVKLMVADGMPQAAIAAALEIAEPTLAKHFAKELLIGRSQKRLHFLKLLEQQAEAGNTSATKAALARTDLAPLPERQKDAPKPKPLGKKEQQAIEAVAPPDDPEWADLIAGGNMAH